MKICQAILIFTLVTLLSCNSRKAQPAFYDSNIESNLTTDNSIPKSSQVIDSEIIVVPFKEKEGVKYIKVTINGCLGVEMIFDTGCSGALISMTEAKYLYQRGCLTQDDYRGASQSQIADGSIVENMVFNLREIYIDDKIRCANVTVTVSDNINAPLLLGNELLNRVASYTIDNEKQIINFKLK